MIATPTPTPDAPVVEPPLAAAVSLLEAIEVRLMEFVATIGPLVAIYAVVCRFISVIAKDAAKPTFPSLVDAL